MENTLSEHRIVFHLATPDTTAYRALIGQLNNVLAVWPTARLEVVIHNKGIDFMRNDSNPLGRAIAELHEKGVVFAVCENTLNARHLTPDDLLPQATFVPVALAELVLKQEAGWSYIKAGY
jgi:intracellular sulfur oxidation DsrE/DsrF family protein